MNQPVKSEAHDNAHESIMEDLTELKFLCETLAVWSDRTLSLKEAQKRINDLKIKFAIKDNNNY